MKKRGVWIFLTVLFATGGIFLISLTREPKTFYEKTLSPSFVQFKQEHEKDSDGDGLKDWEELLWKMDPNNPDTDGDGISDAEEVKRQGAIINSDISRYPATESEEPPEGITQTETDILIQKLFNSYHLLTETNPEASKEEIRGALTESLTKEISLYFKAEPEDIYSLSDIKISKSNTADESKRYGDALAGIILKNFESLPDSEMPIIDELFSADNGLKPLSYEDGKLTIEYDSSVTTEELEKRNEENLNLLNKLADAHFYTARDMLELEVTGVLVEPHLVLVNQMTFIGDGLRGITDIFKDPLTSIASLNKHLQATAKAYNAAKEMNLYFINNQTELEPEHAEFFSMFQ